MNDFDRVFYPYYRYNPWDDGEFLLSLSEETVLPEYCFFPEDGIPQRNPDRYFDYRFDLMLEAESAFRSFLGLLVDFHQKRKFAQFLLYFSDFLEVTYETNTRTLQECRFRIDLSDRVSILYSSRMCGCILFLDGKQDSFHNISPQAIDDLRRLLAEVWENIRDMPVWEVTKGKDLAATMRRRPFRIEKDEKRDNSAGISSKNRVC